MGIMIGFICLILLMLLLLRFVSKRLHWRMLNDILMKGHKYIAFAFLVLSVVHFFLVLDVFQGRSIVIYITGSVVFVAGILLTVVCHFVKDRNKEIKYHHGFSIIMGVFLIIHVVYNVIGLSNYNKAINQIELQEVDLNKVEDGSYEGEYDAGYVYAKVKVTVAEHRLVKVEILKHITERGKPAETIIDNMVKEQKLEVDAVTNATNSSKVIIKACENALSR